MGLQVASFSLGGAVPAKSNLSPVTHHRYSNAFPSVAWDRYTCQLHANPQNRSDRPTLFCRESSSIAYYVEALALTIC
jgi:hypothetical protein